jgi:L-ascorbate metabolism protein UlaG (beta-lactamase superfamily)
MSRRVDDTVLTYHGWSGFTLKYPDAPPLVIDAQSDAGIPLHEDVCLVVTHGHPEHITGTAAYLRNKARTGAASVFASPGPCRYLARRGVPRDRIHPCLPGASHRVGDITIDVFRCRHMPLMPPEKGGTRARLRHIVGNPALAASIVADVIRCPLPGPTLGFRFSHPGGPAVLFYGEYDHCNFTVLDGAPPEIVRFRSLLMAMSYDDPEVRPLLDLEGLKRWLPGRTSGYAQLERAVDRFGTITAWLDAWLAHVG